METLKTPYADLRKLILPVNYIRVVPYGNPYKLMH